MSFFTQLLVIFLIYNFVFYRHQTLNAHDRDQFPHGITKICFRFSSLELDAEDVIEEGRLHDVVHSTEVDLVGFLETEDLPVVAAVFGDATKLGAAEFFHIFLAVLVARYILTPFRLEYYDPVEVFHQMRAPILAKVLVQLVDLVANSLDVVWV